MTSSYRVGRRKEKTFPAYVTLAGWKDCICETLEKLSTRTNYFQSIAAIRICEVVVVQVFFLFGFYISDER